MSGHPVPGWLADDRLCRAAWSRLAEPGDVFAGAAVSALGPAEAVQLVLRGTPLPASVGTLLGERGTRRRLDNALARWRTRLQQLAPERDLHTLERFGGRLLVPGDDEWPLGLEDLQLAAPLAMWAVGPLDAAACLARSVAVVGSRASTAYGEHVAGEVGAGLAQRHISVVSGGAFGIDAAAHRGALAAGGGTVAVLACGVDRYYPRAHESLLREIAEVGLVVAEVPPGSMPMRSRFLQRNRVIAAVSQATVVVEAAWRSGALTTASQAAGLGRALGAVPGPVSSATSAGCHRVLRDFSAVCVTDAAEAAELVQPIGQELPAPPDVPSREHDDLAPTDVRVLDALPVRTGVGVGSLSAVAGIPVRAVEASLGRLSMLGLADSSAGDGQRLWRRVRVRRPEQLTAILPG